MSTPVGDRFRNAGGADLERVDSMAHDLANRHCRAILPQVCLASVLFFLAKMRVEPVDHPPQ